MNIHPIQTRYKGYHFRSRAEARWAVFFDYIDETWTYEPEGYDLGDAGLYLPDFMLNEIGGYGPYVEVKGVPPSDDEINKMCVLCERACAYGVIVYGNIVTPSWVNVHKEGFVDERGSYASFDQCYIFDQVYSNVLSHAHATEIVTAALRAAASARFEHGHSGAS